ncbi:MAG: T9SS type A sorting domain-containing protein [Chitinophagales bacterium]|nr:T9SS type A sorting domain-containing protein [Chitinophagales bacterium]
MKLKITTLSTWMLSILFSIQSFAQDGTLDPTFGVGGKVTTDLGLEGVMAIAIQSDGKIVAAGTYKNGVNLDFGIARYKTNGTLDSSFSGDGIQFTDFNSSDDEAFNLAILPDGKIIVVGYTYKSNLTLNDYAIAKYNSDGSLDNTFGTSGKVITDIDDDIAKFIKVMSDGKFFVGGNISTNPRFTLAKYNSNGTLDLSFNTTGYIETDLSSISSENLEANSMVIQTDNKIVVCGTEISGSTQKGIYVRYLANGKQDSTYGTNGVVFFGKSFPLTNRLLTSNSILVENNSIVSCMTNSGKLAIIKINSNGKVDSSFGLNGIGRMKWGSNGGRALTRQTDGKFIVVGDNYNALNPNISGFLISRFNSNGGIDSTFSGDGVDTIRIKYFVENSYDVKIQSDGKIIIAGRAVSPTNNLEFALARYISALKVGILDFSSSEKNLIVSPNPIESESILEYSLDADVENLSIGLYDLNGKQLKIFMQGKSQLKGDHKEKITLPEGLAAGNYIIQIASPKGHYSVKIAH